MAAEVVALLDVPRRQLMRQPVEARPLVHKRHAPAAVPGSTH
eukprot:CAMPEP_0172561402 /NCGR_PEP_ID=MMETSP1067-20121228/92799_1 /TAXON_ID=265564 ORGANISM="Thalassiosira punctigera, Strain Tpunct2005C2" /NCGR_SAMPLE_ID=MMETSP1067 /ASSEMBLY_ACC=CAM_ASM_000444 /LENGTH=41 /DNA_ID= /DNA_START= /DNA_END= /DNA_ORIENTATION=